MSLLRIRNLTVEFTTASGPFRAVDSVDLDVDTGDVVAIVGESGSGKSVSMLALMGLLPWTATITADELSFEGRDLRRISPDRAAPDHRQGHGDDLPGADVLAQPLLHRRLPDQGGAAPASEPRPRASATPAPIELFEQVGIPDPERRLGTFPHQMSGGMNQRVMIAMAIACNPKLLIADEPTTALDVTIQAQILDLLARLREETGMALVLITHDMGVVAETAERVSVQYAGQKVEEQPVGDLFNTPAPPLYRRPARRPARARHRRASCRRSPASCRASSTAPPAASSRRAAASPTPTAGPNRPSRAPPPSAMPAATTR